MDFPISLSPSLLAEVPEYPSNRVDSKDQYLLRSARGFETLFRRRASDTGVSVYSRGTLVMQILTRMPS